MIAITAQRFMCRIRMLELTSLSLILTLVSPHPNGRAAKSSTGDDVELARRASGDPNAFTELYHHYLPGIYRYHLARTGHVQEAKDLTAQTFLTALESISSFRGQGSFSSWLFGIASHKLADHYRPVELSCPWKTQSIFSAPSPCQRKPHSNAWIWHV